MKKVLKKAGQFILKNALGLILGLIAFTAVGADAPSFLLSAQDVTYDNTDSGAAATNVKGALDELDAKAEALLNSYDAYEAGDSVSYDNESYHVIADSSTTQDYVVLLKDSPINSGNSSSYGSNSTYASSTIKTAIDTWEQTAFTNDELEEVDNYTTRLITLDELIEFYPNCTSSSASCSTESGTPNWLYNSNYTYWTMEQYSSSTTDMWTVGTDGSLASTAVATATPVIRPVINLKKEALAS